MYTYVCVERIGGSPTVRLWYTESADARHTAVRCPEATALCVELGFYGATASTRVVPESRQHTSIPREATAILTKLVNSHRRIVAGSRSLWFLRTP